MKKKRAEFIRICKKTQKELKKYVSEKLFENGYKDIVSGDGFVYAKGTVPVLLVAHMDTVHKEIPLAITIKNTIDNNTVISSKQGIGGDDRCGVFSVLEIIKEHKCSVLFTEDEEIGCIGARKFTASDMIKEIKDLNYMIELDRRGNNDAVFYECDNPDFTSFITKNTGYKEEWGSYSDICEIARDSGIAAVNLSCGYYNEHTKNEYVIFEETMNTINVVKKLLTIESEKFEYVEAYSGYNWFHYNSLQGKSGSCFHSPAFKNANYLLTLEVYLAGEEVSPIIIQGSSVDNCWKEFFMEYGYICYNDVMDYYFY